MSDLEYWKECISQAAEEVALPLPPQQLTALAESVKGAHEHYGMAFYSPPSSDRLNDIEREWKEKYKRLEAQLETYRTNAEEAVKMALHVHREDNVSIGANGEVLRHGGRTEQIQ